MTLTVTTLQNGCSCQLKVPIVCAVAGAGVNYAFTDYYQEIARVRFGLRRLAIEHGEERIRQAFRDAVAALSDADRAALGLRGLADIPTDAYLAVPTPRRA